MNIIHAIFLAPTICLLASCTHTSSKIPAAAPELATTGALVPMPEHGASTLGRIHSDFIEGMGKIDGRFIILLNVNRVLSGDEMSALSDVGAAAPALP